jgi:hypothetical protein
MRNAASLGEADHLIDADLFEFPQARPDHFRSSDAILDTALRRRELVRVGFELVPNIGSAGHVFPEKAVMPQAVNEETVVFGAYLIHLILVAAA